MAIRNQYYDIFSKAILDQIKHVTDAIEEFQQSFLIDWTAVEWQRPQKGEERATAIIVYGREMVDDEVRTIYGIVPLDVVASGSKQIVLDHLKQVMAEINADKEEEDDPDLSLLDDADSKPKPTLH